MAWMFEKDMTLDELNEYWKECYETDNMIKKRMPMRLYVMAKETYTWEEKEKAIIEKIYEPDRRFVKKVTLIDDNSAIIESFEKIFGDEEKTWYRVYCNGKISNTVTEKFDMALLRLVALKSNNEEATGWMAKLIDLVED
jgi:hypothetical protein